MRDEDTAAGPETRKSGRAPDGGFSAVYVYHTTFPSALSCSSPRRPLGSRVQ
jgi:hypothetical protein